jgi:hypothetical protein
VASGSRYWPACSSSRPPYTDCGHHLGRISPHLLADEGLAAQSLQHRVVNGTASIIGEAKAESQVETARQVAL